DARTRPGQRRLRSGRHARPHARARRHPHGRDRRRRRHRPGRPAPPARSRRHRTRGPPVTDHPIRLLLADDHPVVRAGLRAVLETEPGLTVVAEAATAEDAVARAAQGDIDVVLMDLQFGKGMGGAEATAQITARPGAPRVLIVTTYDSDADTLPAIEAGATGYLLKDAP